MVALNTADPRGRWAVIYESAIGAWIYGAWSSDVVASCHPNSGEIGPRFDDGDKAAECARALNRANFHPAGPVCDGVE